jgi:hypothetical protein
VSVEISLSINGHTRRLFVELRRMLLDADAQRTALAYRHHEELR